MNETVAPDFARSVPFASKPYFIPSVKRVLARLEMQKQQLASSLVWRPEFIKALGSYGVLVKERAGRKEIGKAECGACARPKKNERASWCLHLMRKNGREEKKKQTKKKKEEKKPAVDQRVTRGAHLKQQNTTKRMVKDSFAFEGTDDDEARETDSVVVILDEREGEEKEKEEEEGDDNNNNDDDDDDDDNNNNNDKEEERGSAQVTFNVGDLCAKRAECFHGLHHFSQTLRAHCSRRVAIESKTLEPCERVDRCLNDEHFVKRAKKLWGDVLANAEKLYGKKRR